MYIKTSGTCSIVGETLNCKREVKNPQDLHVIGLRKYGTTVGHVLHVISCICMLFCNKAWWCHQAHFDWSMIVFPRLPTERSRIASTVIYYIFGKELCLSCLK